MTVKGISYRLRGVTKIISIAIFRLSLNRAIAVLTKTKWRFIDLPDPYISTIVNQTTISMKCAASSST